MELADCAFRAARRRRDRQPEALRRRRRRLPGRRAAARPGHGAQGPALANAQIFGPGQGDRGARRRNARVLVVGNPANTNALIAARTPRASTRAISRHDPARPQPRPLAARREDRRPRQRHPPHDDLGQPLVDPVPRHRPRTVGGKPALGRFARLVPRRPSSRRCSSGARRSSRRAAPRRRRPRRRRRSTTCATGCAARPPATGCRWRCRRTAATASPREWCTPTPALRGGDYRSSGPRGRRVRRGKMQATDAELREERAESKDLL